MAGIVMNATTMFEEPVTEAWGLHQAAAMLFDTWVEAIIIALALHLYFRFTGVGGPTLLWWMRCGGPRNGKRASADEDGGKQRPMPPPPPHPPAEVSRAKPPGLPRADVTEAMAVHTLVSSVLRRGAPGASGAQDALAQYERLVRDQRLDLRQHMPDDHDTRMLYAGFVEIWVRSVAPCAVSGQVDDLAVQCEAVHIPAGTKTPSARALVQRLLKDMSMFGFSRGFDFYSAVFKVLTTHGLLEDALWLHDAMVADGIHPDRQIYICLISIAVSLGEDRRAIGFFRELSRAGTPAMRTYMTLLRIFTKRRDWRGAVDLLEGLRVNSVTPDALVLNTVLGLCVSGDALDVAEQLLHAWEDVADTVSCNILFKGYAQQVDLPRAERLLAKMVARGPAPNIISFNTMMDCAVRAIQVHCSRDRGRSRRFASGADHIAARNSAGGAAAAAAARPWRLLDQLLHLGLEPDRYTCSTLVKGMHLSGCTGRDIDRTMDLLRRIGWENLHAAGQGSSACGEGCNGRLLEVLFNTLLDACVSIRDLDRLAVVFGLMGTFEVELSAVTFGTLIKAYGQAGRLSRCHEVWFKMREAKVKPTIVTYGCYIDACTRNSDMEAAMRVLASMADDRVKPNAVIYTSLIRGYAHAKMPLKALELYQEMRHHGIDATAVTFNSVLDIIARQLSDPARLREVVDDMQQAAIKPDVVTYSILVKANCNAGNIAAAIALFRQLREHGLVFDEVAFNTLLLACSNAGKVACAEEIFQEMLDTGVAPTHVTMSILVKMYGKAKQLSKAVEVSRKIEASTGLKPNLYAYTCLIQACVRSKQVQASWDVFARMLCAGVVPDAITYGTAIQGCIYHNKFEQALALLRHAYMVPPPDGTTIFHALAYETNELEAATVGALEKQQRPVALQRDILHALTTALRRKGITALASEVDWITSGKLEAQAPSRGLAVFEWRSSRRPSDTSTTTESGSMRSSAAWVEQDARESDSFSSDTSTDVALTVAAARARRTGV